MERSTWGPDFIGRQKSYFAILTMDPRSTYGEPVSSWASLCSTIKPFSNSSKQALTYPKKVYRKINVNLAENPNTYFLEAPAIHYLHAHKC